MDDNWDDDGYFEASLSDEEYMMDTGVTEPQYQDFPDEEDEAQLKEAASVAEPPTSAMKRKMEPTTASKAHKAVALTFGQPEWYAEDGGQEQEEQEPHHGHAHRPLPDTRPDHHRLQKV